MGRDNGLDAGARRLRRGLVAGVAGGVGTTTVATAIGGRDCGVFLGRPVDVLVCRATGDSLLKAARAAQLVVADGRHRPVLAVTPADASGLTRPVIARMRLLEPNTAAVIVLPFVRRWKELAVPLDEVRGLLSVPLTELPRPLRRYAARALELRMATGLPAPSARRPIAVPAPERTPPTCTR
jgi:hypothetical protein